MLTENYTFKLGDDGVVLNTDPSLPFVDITRVVGLNNTPYRQTERQHEGVDGGFMDAEYEQGRHVILEGDIYADTDSMEDYLDTLKEDYGPSKVPVPFYFKSPGKDERVLFVKPLGMRYDWDTPLRIGVISGAQFLVFAEDPRIYTSALQETVIDVNFATDVTGFDFDFEFDFSFGAAIIGNGEDVVVGGNRPTPPTLTIDVVNGPCVNPRIVNLTYDRELRLDITLLEGDSLVLDTQRRTVLLNGTANRRSSLIVDQWFSLEPGTNFIGFRSDSSDDSTLTVSYRDAWR